MNKKELEKFKKALIQKRKGITAEISNITKDALSKSQREASGDLSGYSLHMADAATDNYDREFSLNLATDNQEVVYAIDEALRRIKDKSYGSCLECKKDISRKRLQAMPDATSCIKCQRQKEENKK